MASRGSALQVAGWKTGSTGETGQPTSPGVELSPVPAGPGHWAEWPPAGAPSRQPLLRPARLQDGRRRAPSGTRSAAPEALLGIQDETTKQETLAGSFQRGSTVPSSQVLTHVICITKISEEELLFS